ncbi:unnamed protein product [Oreochromis niloticus]|nr:unnamed protein product [Mustela putorius furo]
MGARNRFPHLSEALCKPHQEANNKHHGLVNQGATCYLNSVLQVLFMTEDFREAVKRSSKQNAGLLGALTDLFDNLQKQTADTHKIITQLGINRVYEQRDAAECIEKILTMTSPEASQIFHGLLANQITCSKGHKETDRDAPFWHLPLSLVDFYNQDYSVVNGIEEFFRPTYLNGEHQMYCDHCGHKVDATITDVIKHHPDVLILLLKRFEFSYSYMSYFKISCFVEIPYSLQIPESEAYELYAVVDHFGGLRGGHYSATIKIQEEDRWYKFDDAQVTPLAYQPFQEKSQSAYLLFYRKAKSKSHNCYNRDLFLYICFILLFILLFML